MMVASGHVFVDCQKQCVIDPRNDVETWYRTCCRAQAWVGETPFVITHRACLSRSEMQHPIFASDPKCCEAARACLKRASRAPLYLISTLPSNSRVILGPLLHPRLFTEKGDPSIPLI